MKVITAAALVFALIVGVVWRQRSATSPDLDELRKDELYDRAKRAGVEGRSRMSKDELKAALAKS